MPWRLIERTRRAVTAPRHHQPVVKVAVLQDHHPRALVFGLGREVHLDSGRKMDVLLPPPDKTGICPLGQHLRAHSQAQVARTLGETVERVARCAQQVPAVAQRLALKVIAGGYARPAMLGQVGRGVLKLDSAHARADDRPALFPAHRGQKCLAAQVKRIAVVGSHGQADHPPLAGLRLDHVGVSGADDGMVQPQVAVGEDGVAPVALIGPGDRFAARNGHRVVVFRACLGDHQVIHPVDLVQVWSLAVQIALDRPVP